MKFLITMGLLLSSVAKASITHHFTGEAWVQDCNANQTELSRQSERKALEGATQKCGAEPSSVRMIREGILRRWSPYANPGEVCTGTLSYHTIEFSCPNDQFRIIGVSMDGSLSDAKDAAFKEAEKICSGGHVERVSEWVDRSRPSHYWFEFRASALFKCL
jgi:hypothetical protein